MKLPEYYYDHTFSCFKDVLIDNESVEEYAANEQLVGAGDYMDNSYYVEEGVIRLYIIAESGAEKTEWFIGAGGLFPLYSPLERHYKGERDQLLVKTQTTAKLVKIPQKKIADLLKSNSNFALKMLRQYADFSAILLYDIINLSAQDNMTKICNYLYQYEKLLKPHEIILTQEEIANNIGIPHLTLGRYFQKLRQAGIIRTSRKKVEITDWAALIAKCSPELLED